MRIWVRLCFHYVGLTLTGCAFQGPGRRPKHPKSGALSKTMFSIFAQRVSRDQGLF